MLNKRSFTFGNYKEESWNPKAVLSFSYRKSNSFKWSCYECTGFYGYDRSLIKCGASVIMNEKAQCILEVGSKYIVLL